MLLKALVVSFCSSFFHCQTSINHAAVKMAFSKLGYHYIDIKDFLYYLCQCPVCMMQSELLIIGSLPHHIEKDMQTAWNF